MSAREHLAALIDRTSSGTPDDRRAIALELASTLCDWPADYPEQLRSAYALLLEKIAPQLESDTRVELAARLSRHADIPLSLMSEFFFDTRADVRAAILARHVEERASTGANVPAVNEAALIRAVRDYPPETFGRVMAKLFGIAPSTAARIIADASGDGLAILCKGARLSRVAFSTMAMLTDASLGSAQRKLNQFDSVPEDAAACMVQCWRAQQMIKPVRSEEPAAA